MKFIGQIFYLRHITICPSQFQDQLKGKDLAHALSDFPYYPPLDASTVSASLRPIGDTSGTLFKLIRMKASFLIGVKNIDKIFA